MSCLLYTSPPVPDARPLLHQAGGEGEVLVLCLLYTSKNEVPVVAIVGYTNAGKSTLLNKLTGAEIPANNRLFDTLDTTTRTLEISDTCTVLLSDTVGFIRKLPHHLVEAFKATLEELSFADLLLHVIDASNPEWRCV